jgi:hypothetical protein
LSSRRSGCDFLASFLGWQNAQGRVLMGGLIGRLFREKPAFPAAPIDSSFGQCARKGVGRSWHVLAWLLSGPWRRGRGRLRAAPGPKVHWVGPRPVAPLRCSFTGTGRHPMLVPCKYSIAVSAKKGVLLTPPTRGFLEAAGARAVLLQRSLTTCVSPAA